MRSIEMGVQKLLETITPDIYESLKRAIELGKWADGRRLDKEQKELCMQAVIAYEKNNVSEHERTGYIPPKPHSHCGSDGEVVSETPLKWQ
jgi:uncharacterized protein YeaC (DUF1315 family)